MRLGTARRTRCAEALSPCLHAALLPTPRSLDSCAFTHPAARSLPPALRLDIIYVRAPCCKPTQVHTDISFRLAQYVCQTHLKLCTPQEKARIAQHSTGWMAGQFAAAVGARALVLTHFSSRYREWDDQPPKVGPAPAAGIGSVLCCGAVGAHAPVLWTMQPLKGEGASLVHLLFSAYRCTLSRCCFPTCNEMLQARALVLAIWRLLGYRAWPRHVRTRN